MSAVAIDVHRVEVHWDDGMQGVIDFADFMTESVFRALREPARFRDVRVEDYRHHIYWPGEGSYELDICPDVLRAKVDSEHAAWIAKHERAWHARQAEE